MGARRPRALVFDAGALIAFERNDARLRTLVELAMLHGAALHVPAGNDPTALRWSQYGRQMMGRVAEMLRRGTVES